MERFEDPVYAGSQQLIQAAMHIIDAKQVIPRIKIILFAVMFIVVLLITSYKNRSINPFGVICFRKRTKFLWTIK